VEGFKQHAAETLVDGVAKPAQCLLAHPFEDAEHHHQIGRDHREHIQRVGAAAVRDPIVHLLDEDRRGEVEDRAEEAEPEQRDVCRQQGPQFVEDRR
jgi:hypothetical protein